MKRQRWRNRHHLVPRSRGGGGHRGNLLYMDGLIHLNWHKVFGNRTLREVIRLLQRVERAKRRTQ